MDYIILDIEFNGRKFASEHPMEVIEIGAVRLDSSLQYKDEFSSLIKPIYFSTLNSFIKKKTGIPQEDIDVAARFPKVITAFREWLDQSTDGVLLLTWGGEDMKRIIQDIRMHKMDDAYWMAATYFDLLKGVLRARGLSNDISVEGAMALLELEATGSAHRALDDARMTSEIFRAIFSELDLERAQHYVDTFSNARERKTVKIAIKAMTSQKVVPTWELVEEHYFSDKNTLADPRKLAELKAFFEAQVGNTKK
ncbi:3'-5' exonuclease [Paenibacillus agri]|uniref:Exonuclease domain-containing protein n=1 Tax=Paenibacillus agri TaxID=2744309 RepID=A0A850EE79_9BACL|nr:3'-5' exonuclease [Paenibacillus agri]NUU59028.1 exonuclease domain-containing protein [Paenibacillus agri]